MEEKEIGVTTIRNHSHRIRNDPAWIGISFSAVTVMMEVPEISFEDSRILKVLWVRLFTRYFFSELRCYLSRRNTHTQVHEAEEREEEEKRRTRSSRRKNISRRCISFYSFHDSRGKFFAPIGGVRAVLIEPNVDRYYAAVVKLFELLKDQKPLEEIDLAPGNTNTSLLSEQTRASLHFEVTRAKDRRLETRENPCCFFKVDQRIYATRTKEARDRWMTALRPLKFSRSRGIELENMSHAVMFPEVLDCLKGRVSVVTALKRERHERSQIAKKFRMSCHDKTDEPTKTEREEYIRMLCVCGRWDSWQTRTARFVRF